ncbi:MAG TPA: acyl carrier protein [Actinomycetota bacterium]|nr:acyl carrier protein [Actinomycetota bacterium]
MSAPDVRGRLRALVDEALVVTEGPPVEAAPEEDLFLPEVLDSIGLVTLLGMIEDEWGVRFDDRELTLDLLESLDGLAATIASRVAAAGRKG